MGALLTMACNCKGHNLHSPCNCRGHNLLSLVIAMGLFHYPWQVAGTMGCSGTWANVAGTSGGSRDYHGCIRMHPDKYPWMVDKFLWIWMISMDYSHHPQN